MQALSTGRIFADRVIPGLSLPESLVESGMFLLKSLLFVFQTERKAELQPGSGFNQSIIFMRRCKVEKFLI